jgi:hypothetical protein
MAIATVGTALLASFLQLVNGSKNSAVKSREKLAKGDK